MKKLIILALMALLATGAFAQVTFSGQIEYEYGSSFNSGDTGSTTPHPEKNYGIYDADVRLQANIKADDYNTGLIRMRWRTAQGQNVYGNGATLTTAANNGTDVGIDRVVFTSDIGKALSLPIGWKSTVGLDYYETTYGASDKYQILRRIVQRPTEANFAAGSRYISNYADYWFDTDLWGTKQSFVFADVFTFNAFFSLQGQANTNIFTGTQHDNASQNAGKLKDWYLEAVIAQPIEGLGKFSLELAYMVWSAGMAGRTRISTAEDLGAYRTIKPGQGTIQIQPAISGIKVGDGATLDVYLGYWKSLKQEVGWDALAANIQANFKGGYGLIGFQGYPKNDKVGTAGYLLSDKAVADSKAQILHNVRVAVGYKPVDVFGFDVGAIFYTGGADKVQKVDDATTYEKRKTFNSLDVSAVLYVGKATTFRIGYINVPENDYSIQPLNGDYVKSCLYFISKLAF